MRKTIVSLLAVSLSGATALFGMGLGTASASANKKPIIVGAISGNTGAYAAIGQAAFNSIKMAAAKINASGGVMGRKIKVQYGNDGASATTSALLFKKDVSAGAVAILGSLDTGPTTVALAQSLKFPDVGPIDEGGVVIYPNGPSKPPNSWAWSTSPNGYGVGAAFGTYAMNNCPNGLYVLHDPTAYGVGGLAGILLTYTKPLLGDDAITEDWSSSDPATATMDAEVAKVKASGASCVDIWLTAQDQATFVNEMASVGANFTVLGNDTTNSTGVFPQLAGANANGVFGVELKVQVHPGTQLKSYISAYKKEFHIAPSIWGEVSYDGLMILAKAIKAGNSTSRASLQKQLNRITNYQGLSGSLSFTKKSHTSLNGPQYVLVQYSTTTKSWNIVK